MRGGVAVPDAADARRRQPTGERARDAFDRTLAFLDARARAGDAPATFLLDEVLELRTFESFPGLRHVLREMLAGAGGERQPLRADDPLRRRARIGCCATRTARFEVIHLPPLERRPRSRAMLPPMATSTRRPTIATTSAAPSRRWPTAAPAYVRALGEATGVDERRAAAIRSAR